MDIEGIPLLKELIVTVYIGTVLSNNLINVGNLHLFSYLIALQIYLKLIMHVKKNSEYSTPFSSFTASVTI